jgi:hypothetical protein
MKFRHSLHAVVNLGSADHVADGHRRGVAPEKK